MLCVVCFSWSLFYCFKYLHSWKKQNDGHLVYGKRTSLSSLFLCSSWSYGINWLKRFGDEHSSNYTEQTLT